MSVAEKNRLKRRIRELKIELEETYEAYLAEKRALGEEVSESQAVGAARAKAAAEKAKVKTAIEDSDPSSTPRDIQSMRSRYLALKEETQNLKVREASRVLSVSDLPVSLTLNSSAASNGLGSLNRQNSTVSTFGSDPLAQISDPYPDAHARLDIKAMGLERLLARLTQPGTEQNPTLDVVLMTHRNFVPTPELLSLLLTRAQSVEGYPDDETAVVLLVANVLKTWIGRYFVDFVETENRTHLGGVLNGLASLGSSSGEIAQVLGEISAMLETYDSGAYAESFVYAPSSQALRRAPASEMISAARVTKLCTEQMHPLEVARQLTRRAFAAFKAIRHTEFLKQAWAKDDASVRAPQLLAAIDEFNTTTRWAVSHVLAGSNPHERAHVVCFLIDVASSCMVLNNYASLMAILSALGSVAISRLSSTFAALPKNYEEDYHELSEFMSMSNNSRNYRDAIQAASPPFVPYLGVFLQDLTFIDDGNESKIGENRLINLEKEAMTAAVVKLLLRGRSEDYVLHDVPNITRFLEGRRSLDEDAQYAKSLQIKPRGQKVEAGAEPLMNKDGMTRIKYVPLEGSTRPAFDIGDNDAVMERMYDAMTTRTYQEGEYIIREGEMGSEMFTIREGVATVETPDGRSFPLPTGSMFGEIALFLEMKRTASIWAQTKVEVLVLSKASCDEILADFPHMRTRFRKLGEARLNSDGETPGWMKKLAKTAAKAKKEASEKGLISAMERKLSKLTMPAGELIIREGDVDNGTMYFIADGIVDFELSDGRTFSSNKGSTFGELSLFLSRPRSASVRAHTNVVLYALSKPNCESVLSSFPASRKAMKKIAKARSKNAAGARAMVPIWMKELARSLSGRDHSADRDAIASGGGGGGRSRRKGKGKKKSKAKSKAGSSR